ncbi:hypothetical protein GPS50_14720 [Acinetobacter haemolyticus]|nr:hypothetical protein [Acinetobacter haemolyticus]
MFITSFGEQNITYKCCSNFLIHLCKTSVKNLLTHQISKFAKVIIYHTLRS